MAFEAIVKKQIARLTEPSIKVIDLVVQELTNVVRTVADKVSLGLAPDYDLSSQPAAAVLFSMFPVLNLVECTLKLIQGS